MRGGCVWSHVIHGAFITMSEPPGSLRDHSGLWDLILIPPVHMNDDDCM